MILPPGLVAALDPTVGECCLRLLEDGRVEVTRADPRAWIAPGRLRALVQHPDISVRDDVVTINGSNRRVVYRLTEYVAAAEAWRAEWPD